MKPIAPQKKRDPYFRAFYLSINSPQVLGIPRYLFLLRWLKKNARRVDVNTGSVLYFIQHGERYLGQFLDTLQPWKKNYISAVEDVAIHYFDSRQWKKSLKYLRMLKRDDQLRALLYRFIDLEAKKIDRKLNIIMKYVKQNLKVPIAFNQS